MDMSYKRAWDLVDEINRICRQAAVERQTGGKNGGGAVLTPFGLSLVARYRKIERDAASAVRKELAALQQRYRQAEEEREPVEFLTLRCPPSRRRVKARSSDDGWSIVERTLSTSSVMVRRRVALSRTHVHKPCGMAG